MKVYVKNNPLLFIYTAGDSNAIVNVAIEAYGLEVFRVDDSTHQTGRY